MARHGRRVKRGNRQKFIIIFSIFCVMFIMVSGYAAFSTTLNIGAKGNVVDRSRTIQSWSSTSNEDFHTDFYRENIVSATFLDSAKVPENAKENWDVSVDKDKGVMAYVVESSSETGKYDLFIGAKDGVIANEDSSWFFYNFSGLKSIEFNNHFDTKNAINMYGMFMKNYSLVTIDLSSLDTSNVTNMHDLFSMYSNASADGAGDNALTRITFGGKFKTDNVKDMTSMFFGCKSLEKLDLSTFNTSSATYMGNMFYHCSSLTELDLSSFDTSEVTNMYWMFTSCSKLESLNLCSFDTSNVTDMTRLFSYNTNLIKVKVGPNWTTANAITTNMFDGSGVSSVTSGEC